MPTTYYHTVNGRIRGESTAGVRTDYLTDALGSVVATVDSSAQVVNTYRYKPYGERLTKTGVGADPRFLWAGNTGSQHTGLPASEQYNRRRFFASRIAVWTTRDLLWPLTSSFLYANGNPGSLIDPSGLVSVTVNAFIHKDQDYSARSVVDCEGRSTGGWIPAPPNLSGLWYYRSDGRDFRLGGRASSRAHTRVTADNCSIGQLGKLNGLVSLNKDSNRTQGLVNEDRGGIIPRGCLRYKTAMPEVVVSVPTVTDLGLSDTDGISLIEYTFSARDPLVFLSPHLRGEVRIWLFMEFYTGNLTVRINVRHTRYPWFEAFATDTSDKWLFRYRAMRDDLIGGLQVMKKSGGSAWFESSPCKKRC